MLFAEIKTWICVFSAKKGQTDFCLNNEKDVGRGSLWLIIAVISLRAFDVFCCFCSYHTEPQFAGKF